ASHPRPLSCWQADALETIQARAEQLAAVTGLDVERLLGWCTAFAGMIALELASQETGPHPRAEALLRLAAQAPTDWRGQRLLRVAQRLVRSWRRRGSGRRRAATRSRSRCRTA